MKNLPDISESAIDVRAEVLARLVARRQGLETEQVIFRPNHYFQRAGRRDVVDMAVDFSQGLNKETLQLEISREGLFDVLPEAIFFRPEENYATDVSRMRGLSEQEANGRKFLAPFEQLFYWLRLDNELEEARAEENLADWWLHLDGVDMGITGLDDRRKAILTQMAPFLPNIIGNWSLTAQWLSLFLLKEVKIEEKDPPLYPLPEEVQKRLDQGRLGEDFVIGETFSDGLPMLEIVIKGVKANEVPSYLPAGAEREILENTLLGWLLPVETPYEVVLDGVVANEDGAWYLGGFDVRTQKKWINDVLGLNIRLSR